MSREGKSVIGTVIVTVCVTSGLLLAALIGASRYLDRQAASSVQEEAPAEAPAPRVKKPRARKTAAVGGFLDPGSSTEASSAAAAVADGVAPGDQPSSGGGAGATASAADAEPAGESSRAPAEAAAIPVVPDGRGDARSIMEEAQRRGDAQFYRYDGLLESFDAKNKVTEKRWTFDREGSNGRSKAVLRFTAPAEVKGVALLIFNHQERASDQWMWTPALERDRRIALQDRSTRFFGTDFSFEDLEERDVNQYDYVMLGNDTIDGAECWKIQTTPKPSRSSHYSRSIAWIRKDNYVMARLDNFVDDDVVKRLTNTTIENIQGIWTARQLEMADLRRGTRTRLSLQQVKYNSPMKDADFTLEAIRR